jgi:hypothetical protein
VKNSIKLNLNNNARVTNTVNADLNTGKNEANKNTGNADIDTGD